MDVQGRSRSVVAISEAAADVTVTDCPVDRGSRQLDQLAGGIRMFGGTLALTRTTLTGFDRHGLVIAQPAGARRDAGVASASLEHVLIGAEDTAIDVESDHDLVRLRMRNSQIDGGRRGLALRTGLADIDLGTTGSPGGNRILSDTGPAIDDARSGGAVDAHGTTLNDRSFDGEVQGPASLDGVYALTGSDAIRF